MILIPARLGSSRFPQKVLADVLGLPMVIRTAQAVQGIDNVAIATDAQEVVEVAKKYNIEAVMTSVSHQSGTDRIYEAATILGLGENETILNVQGDEPFIEPEVVQKLLRLTQQESTNPNTLMSSCYKRITQESATNPNMVKVVTTKGEKALYFSRSLIPFPRDGESHTYKGHLGLYGFTMKSLQTFCSLPPAPLEELEKLEQLRALYNGYSVAMTEVETNSFGIDTPEDLERALKVFSR
jgi:3-deoxy-manno-octulosonate cytidylyltransferase (CMP-KDO synthetase)